jgi:signal transduction histidine kinase
MRITAAATRVRRRWDAVPPWVIDAGFATAVTFGGLATALGRSDPRDVYRDPDVVAVALVLAGTIPYYVRRRAPSAVFAVTSIAVAALMLRGYDAGALPLVLLMGAYTVGAYGDTREVVAGTVLISALLVTLFARDVPEFDAAELVTSEISFGVAILAGGAFRSRRQKIELLEQEQAHAASRAAADERLRIAQELHDIVAHSLGVIAVQAGVGMKVIDVDVAEARRSFESISRLSRASLSEIRQLLAVVRGEGVPTYAPAPRLSDVARLVHDMADAGLPVELTLEGDLECVPAGVGLAAYRIVQEALRRRGSGSRAPAGSSSSRWSTTDGVRTASARAATA